MGSHKSVILGSPAPSGGAGPSSTQFPATLGQKTMANSLAVVVASDQTAIPVSSTQLPTTIGQKAAAASTSVVLASDDHTKGQAGPLALPAEAANILSLVQYKATPPTLTDGQVALLGADANGYARIREQYGPVAEDETNGVYATQRLPLSVATYALSHEYNAQLATNAIIKASAGVVYGRVIGYLDLAIGAGTFYVLALNEVSAVNGTRALLRAPRKIVVPAVPVDMPFELDFGDGVYFSTGLTICVSTTAGNGVKTANVTLATANLIVESCRFK
jgi:hypothetical protein